MRTRLDLHAEFKELLGSDEVYYQPPESICMRYPAIVYKKTRIGIRHADNYPYLFMPNYEVEVIYLDPDEDWMNKMFKHFKYVSFSREFVMNNLHHSVFNLYY
jgi:hypothetical protein